MRENTLWPEGYSVAFAIGIDDVHPEPQKHRCDCGGFRRKVWKPHINLQGIYYQKRCGSAFPALNYSRAFAL